MTEKAKGSEAVLEDALASAVSRYYEASRRALGRAFREHDIDISVEHWAVITALAERGPCSQGFLGERMHRDAPTTSRIIDTMSRAGYVQRDRDPEDKRAHRVTLTRKGADVKKKLLPVVKRLLKKMETGVSAGDLATTQRTLQKLVDKMS